MKSAQLFIDTGAFYAKYVPRDAHHSEALRLWERVAATHTRCVTTNFVMAELITLLGYRFGARAGLQAAREIYGSHAIQILPLSLELEMAALDWLNRFAEHPFSMTDACSFACMTAEKITQAFSFDHHFQIAGFTPFA